MKYLLAGTVAAIAILSASTTMAEPRCGDRARVIGRLTGPYKETRRAIGLSEGGYAIVELFASSQTGSWSIIATLPSGRSCLIASGDAFAAPAHATPDEDA